MIIVDADQIRILRFKQAKRFLNKNESLRPFLMF